MFGLTTYPLLSIQGSAVEVADVCTSPQSTRRLGNVMRGNVTNSVQLRNTSHPRKELALGEQCITVTMTVRHRPRRLLNPIRVPETEAPADILYFNRSNPLQPKLPLRFVLCQ